MRGGCVHFYDQSCCSVSYIFYFALFVLYYLKCFVVGIFMRDAFQLSFLDFQVLELFDVLHIQAQQIILIVSVIVVLYKIVVNILHVCSLSVCALVCSVFSGFYMVRNSERKQISLCSVFQNGFCCFWANIRIILLCKYMSSSVDISLRGNFSLKLWMTKN